MKKYLSILILILFASHANAQNNAIAFDGNGDYAEIAHSNDFNLTNEITFEVWIKPQSMTNCPILSKNNIYWLHWDYDYEYSIGKGFQINLAGTSSGWWEFEYNIEYGNWYHIAWTYSNNILKSYVNGVITRQATVSNTLSTNSSDLIIDN
ncbi:MAG: LamG domain-containing protein [Bacteroidetes bacterium]|jgi:hypothetical protein|nr:LamG domain-containing protein [Bacteroidota bacterium]MBT7142513.1 LamG domain-containing protein [Bacteroidota bacterium]MBT7490721.1 LamG domain-containing protein [Bacteroidota bacterium]